MQKYQKLIIVIILMLVFTALFMRNVRSDFPLIFQKDLLAHDESSNSVVGANVTRQFFPPMVRVNPLNTQQGNWMEGPFWQHIPPLFAYVPYLFFKLDGQITIEVKRLSYALVALLTGLLFIWSIYRFRKNLWAAGSATVATIFWINTPFTHELITGYAFGVSDIVLAFTVVCGFAGILCYLEKEKSERLEYPWWKLALITLLVALPIAAKNLLGAIPAATFFILLLRDHKKINRPVLISSGAFVGLLLLHLLPLYFSSPETFKSEILVPFYHFRQLEGWGRPWHWYIANYLPQRYLLGWTWVYYLGLTLGLVLCIKYPVYRDRKNKILLGLSGGWFAWNLLAISLVTSKVPNFIYQSYLLSLFFIVYSIVSAVIPSAERAGDLFKDGFPYRNSLIIVLTIVIFIMSYETVRFVQQFKIERAQGYNYQSEHEKFYQFVERLRGQGLDTRDLVIVNNPPDDCWERYYILFLTGSESKTLLEMHFNTVPDASINQKYRAIYFVDQNFAVRKITTADLGAILNANKESIEQDIQRIKKDKNSCQWLVPDMILNAP